MTYKLYKTVFGKDAVVKTNEDGSTTSFLLDLANPDYQQYLKWLEEGNTPEPADQGEA
jgi:hypothetical protein